MSTEMKLTCKSTKC